MSTEFTNNVNSKHPLGKGEVDSSILSGSTRKPHETGVSDTPENPARQYPAEHHANTTSRLVENPWSLFAVRSELRERGHRLLAEHLGLAGRYPHSAALRIGLAEIVARTAKETKIGP